MRVRLIALVAVTLGSRAASAQLVTSPEANPLGTWRGSSHCVAPRADCSDEVVVYRITQPRSRDSLSVRSSRLVDGHEKDSGVLACDLNAARAIVTCAVEGGKWRFAFRHDSLVGQLRLRDGTWFRDVHAVRATTPPEPPAPSFALDHSAVFLSVPDRR